MSLPPVLRSSCSEEFGCDDMRCRLRTLVVLTAIGPPALAALWFSPAYLPPEAMKFAYLLFGAVVLVSVVAGIVSVPLLLGWLFSVIADRLIRLLVHPN